MYSTDQMWERMKFLEYEITKCCLRGTDMVPQAEDLPYIRSLALEIFNLSNGLNEVRFDRLGRPSIMVNIFCDEKARLAYLSNSNTFFNVSGIFTADAKVADIAPAFIVNNQAIRGFRLGKYTDVRVEGKNYHLSLYGLDPAYSGGGHTQSYSGIASECDRINAGGYAEGDTVHNITKAEFSYLGLLAVREGFQVRGADYYGKSGAVQSEQGDPCGYKYNGQYIHVKTGSGVLAWYHNGSPFGVWGLRGPTFMIQHGYQLDSGELLFIPNNDAATMTAAQLAETSDNYKALQEDGSFVTRGGDSATMKYDYINTPPETGSAGFQICTTITNRQPTDAPYGGQSLASMTAREGVTIPLYMRLMLMAPLLTGTPSGVGYMRNTQGARRISSGGAYWLTGSSGGFGYSYGDLWGFGVAGIGGSGRVASLM